MRFIYVLRERRTGLSQLRRRFRNDYGRRRRTKVASIRQVIFPSWSLAKRASGTCPQNTRVLSLAPSTGLAAFFNFGALLRVVLWLCY